jgi:hypothetical protein
VWEPLLTQTLRVSHGLTSLNWEWLFCKRDISNRDPVFTDPVIQLDHIVSALQYVKDTLTDLAICGMAWIYVYEPQTTQVKLRGSLTGLVRFEKLKRLRAPLVFLMHSFSPNTNTRLEEGRPSNLEHISTAYDFLY